MIAIKKSRAKNKKYLPVPLISIPYEPQTSNFIFHNIFENIFPTFDEDINKQFKQLVPKRHKSTQTDYRDSETQTVPWEPSYVIKNGNLVSFFNFILFTKNKIKKLILL